MCTIVTIHDQWFSHSSGLSLQRYTYDKAGRLTRAADTPTGQGCVTRAYTYDADSNRTKLQTYRRQFNPVLICAIAGNPWNPVRWITVPA